MVASKQATVTERRAVLTDRERDIVAGEADVSDSYRYQTISRVRARFDRLAGDLEAMEAHGDLAAEFRAIVCPRDPDTQAAESGRERAETPSGDAPVGLDSFEYKRDLTAARRAVLAEWVDHVRGTGDSVKKSDFEAWFTDDHEARAGYNAGSFWEAFAKETMTQSDRFGKPNTRAYRWTGDTDA